MSEVIIGIKIWNLSDMCEVFVDGVKVGDIFDVNAKDVITKMIEAAHIDNVKVEELSK